MSDNFNLIMHCILAVIIFVVIVYVMAFIPVTKRWMEGSGQDGASQSLKLLAFFLLLFLSVATVVAYIPF